MRIGLWLVLILSGAETLALGAAERGGRACELEPIMTGPFDLKAIGANKIGPARWIAHTPWGGDFGDATFVDPGPDGPFSVRDGVLSITASKRPNGRWVSGLLAAADAAGRGTGSQYGYFEARMKIPPGPGTWPAFWLAALKPAASSDGNVEIDSIEYYGQFTDAYRAAVHVWYKDQTKTRGVGTKIDVPPNSLVEQFHNYGVDISPKVIAFVLDGKEVWRMQTPAELDTPMYPIVDLALGSGWPIDRTPNPSRLEVEYIHVFGRGPAEGCPVGVL